MHTIASLFSPEKIITHVIPVLFSSVMLHSSRGPRFSRSKSYLDLHDSRLMLHSMIRIRHLRLGVNVHYLCRSMPCKRINDIRFPWTAVTGRALSPRVWKLVHDRYASCLTGYESFTFDLPPPNVCVCACVRALALHPMLHAHAHAHVRAEKGTYRFDACKIRSRHVGGCVGRDAPFCPPAAYMGYSRERARRRKRKRGPLALREPPLPTVLYAPGRIYDCNLCDKRPTLPVHPI